MTGKEPSAEQELLNPTELFRTLGTIRKTAKPLEPLWGYLLYKKAVTSIIGDPGVCKTTMGYGLGTALCCNKAFLDITPEEPVNVLYMDFESSDSLVISRANLVLGNMDDIPNFYIYNIVDFYLPHITQVAIQFCNEHDINLIIIDNQSMAFSTRDENDNAEAIKQMKFIRAFTNACDAATILFHHSSKADLPGTRKGSGAFARARLADICINIEIPDENSKDIIRFETAKNRMVDEKVLWYLKKEEGGFIFTDPPLGVGGAATSTMIYKAQKALLEILADGIKHKFKELVKDMSKAGFTESWVDHATRRLVQQNRIFRPEYGYLCKQNSVKPPR